MVVSFTWASEVNNWLGVIGFLSCLAFFITFFRRCLFQYSSFARRTSLILANNSDWSISSKSSSLCASLKHCWNTLEKRKIYYVLKTIIYLSLIFIRNGNLIRIPRLKIRMCGKFLVDTAKRMVTFIIAYPSKLRSFKDIIPHPLFHTSYDVVRT